MEIKIEKRLVPITSTGTGFQKQQLVLEAHGEQWEISKLEHTISEALNASYNSEILHPQNRDQINLKSKEDGA